MFQEESLNIWYFFSGIVFILLPVVLMSIYHIIRDFYPTNPEEAGGPMVFLTKIGCDQYRCRVKFCYALPLSLFYFCFVFCCYVVVYLIFIFCAIIFTFYDWAMSEDKVENDEDDEKKSVLYTKKEMNDIERMKLFEHIGESMPQLILSIVFIVKNGGIAANLMNSVSAAFSAGSLLIGIIKSCFLWIKNDDEDSIFRF